MQGTYYETDRLLAVLIPFVFGFIFYGMIWFNEKKHGVNRRNRARYYRKNRNERKW